MGRSVIIDYASVTHYYPDDFPQPFTEWLNRKAVEAALSFCLPLKTTPEYLQAVTDRLDTKLAGKAPYGLTTLSKLRQTGVVLTYPFNPAQTDWTSTDKAIQVYSSTQHNKIIILRAARPYY